MNKLNFLMNADDNLSLTEIINLMNNLIKLPRNDHFCQDHCREATDNRYRPQ